MSSEDTQGTDGVAPDVIGYFRVINQSTFVIYGTVEHRDDAAVDFQGGLAQGASTGYRPFKPTAVTDTWHYLFKSDLGTFQGNKDCSFSSSADSTVSIILSNKYLAIVPSETSPCTGGLSRSGVSDDDTESTALHEPEKAAAPA